MRPFLLTSSYVKLIKNDATNIIIYTILSTLNFPTCRVDYIIKILKIIRDLWGKDEIGENLDKRSEARALIEGLKLAIDEDNVKINLNNIKDNELVAQMTREIKELENQGDVLMKKAKTMANNYIG